MGSVSGAAGAVNMSALHVRNSVAERRRERLQIVWVVSTCGEIRNTGVVNSSGARWIPA